MSLHKQQLIIKGPAQIQSTQVNIAGSKNAALPIIAASVLAKSPVILKRIPHLADTQAMLETLSYLGGKIRLDEDMKVHIDPRYCKKNSIPSYLAKKMRTSFLFLGPILATCKQATIPLPGGCNIGARPVDIHIAGLKQMGAEIELRNNTVYAKTTHGLHATNYTLPFPSVTGTENLLMAACLAKGTTILKNTAQDPEVGNLIDFLNIMGAEIHGKDTSTLTIVGKKELSGGEHSIIGDRIEAGTYLIAATLCQGSIELCDINPDHLRSVISKLRAAGADIQTSKDSIKLVMNTTPKAVDITTQPYPGFPTDLQAQWLTLNTVATGNATITEEIYENRMAHAQQLRILGADINIENNKARTQGNARLTASHIHATDLRASAGLVLAALVANGETVISDIHHLDRGYSHLEENLMAMGIKIRRIHNQKTTRQPSKAKIKTIIFDWDGTLVNTLPTIIQAHTLAIKSLQLPQPSDSRLRSLMGSKASTVIRELFPSLNVDEQNTYTQVFLEHYRAVHTKHITCLETVKSTLECLVKHGFSLCVATNKRREFFQAELTALGIAKFITHSCCGDEYPAKPETTMLTTLLEKTTSKNTECLMIGDHHNDIIAANHAGIASIALTGGSLSKEQLQSHQPTHIINEISEVLTWLNIEQVPA